MTVKELITLLRKGDPKARWLGGRAEPTHTEAPVADMLRL